MKSHNIYAKDANEEKVLVAIRCVVKVREACGVYGE